MIRISVVHPSFGRHAMAFHRYREWMLHCDHPEYVEYLVGLDDDDPEVVNYQQMFAKDPTLFGRLEINVGDSRGVIGAVNRVAAVLSPMSALIIAVSDDLSPCPHWDTELLDLIAGVDPMQTIRFIGIQDGRLTDEDFQHLFVTRAWYTRFGYLLCPEYVHFGADNDANYVAHALDAIIPASKLMFRHLHYDRGLSAYDATYARHRTPEAYSKASDILHARMARNFDL